MIFSLAAAEEGITVSVNLSMLARTASMSGKPLSSSSADNGPSFGGVMTSQPALRRSCSADAPTSFIVRAVIRTFQDMAAECNAFARMRKRGDCRFLAHEPSLRPRPRSRTRPQLADSVSRTRTRTIWFMVPMRHSERRLLMNLVGRDSRRVLAFRLAMGKSGLDGSLAPPFTVLKAGADNWIWCQDRKSTRLNSSHLVISYAVFC